MSKRRNLHHRDEVSGPDANSGEKKPYDDVKPYNINKVDPYNPLSWLAIPWHLGMVVFYSLLFYQGGNIMSDNKHIYDPDGRVPALGGRFKYLTQINLHVQIGFFITQLLADVLPKPVKKNVKKLADIIFAVAAFPLATLVTSTFWGLYAIDRQLIFPEVFDLFVPTYMNHFWHSTILLWVLFEVFLVYHHFPSSPTASMLIFVYGAGYIGWVVYIFVQTNWWVYPFMKVLPLYGMALFFGCSLFLVLGFYLLGKILSYARWGMITHLD